MAPAHDDPALNGSISRERDGAPSRPAGADAPRTQASVGLGRNLLRSSKIVLAGALLCTVAMRLPFAMDAPFRSEFWSWDASWILGLLLGGLGGLLVEMAIHGVRGRVRRFVLGYMALAVASALLLPLLVFGGSLLKAAEAAPGRSGAVLFLILLAAILAHAAFACARTEGGAEPEPEGEVAAPTRYLWVAGGTAILPLVGWISYVQPGSVSLVLDAYLLLAGLMVGANVVAALRRQLRREALAAREDALTGLLNRKGFLHDAGRELRRSVRYGTPLTLACIDLDHFKAVNDDLGHLAGDALLRAVGRTLRVRAREHDVVARLGGDEFALLLPCLEPGEAAEVLWDLRTRLLGAMDEERWPVTFSIGAVSGVPESSDLEALVEAADALMYRVKHGGKDGVSVEPLSGGARSRIAVSR